MAERLSIRDIEHNEGANGFSEMLFYCIGVLRLRSWQVPKLEPNRLSIWKLERLIIDVLHAILVRVWLVDEPTN